MSSRTETLTKLAAGFTRGGTLVETLLPVAAFCWGLSAFLPVGVVYLQVFLMLTLLLLCADTRQRLLSFCHSSVAIPLASLLVWTLIAAMAGSWYPDTATRLFHTFRIALVMCMGLMLRPTEARWGLAGFLMGALLAALVVAAHHVWGLPKWSIWYSLLESRNNFSSGNMISMAVACGVLVFLCVRIGATTSERLFALAAATGLGLTVALHAASRNSILLLAVLLVAVLLFRFRSWLAVLAGLTAVLILVAAAWQFSPSTKARFVEIASNFEAIKVQSNYSTSVGVRWRMYQEAVQGMVEHPVFGTGLGSWLPRWSQVWLSLDQQLPPEYQKRFAEINNPHNDFLLAGMETGVIGMLLLVWLLARFIKVGWNQGSTAGGVTVVMGVALSVTALVNAPFRDAALGMTLVWLLAVSVAAHGKAGHA